MNEWFKEKPACVILCGGRGSRLFPLSLYKQKSMMEINGKPILKHIIEYWKPYTNKFVFVVKHKKEGIINFIRTLPIQAEFIEPAEINGLADAISYVKPYVGERFFVVLGDCICKGKFNFPENMEQGVGVCETENNDEIARSYSVELSDGTAISRIVEKPQIIPNKFCGMGFYFFDKRIFEYIIKNKDKTDDLTTVMQHMVNSGEKLHAVHFKGRYLNITYPHDIEKAKDIQQD